MSHRFELFHEIADPQCASARRYVTNQVPEGLVRFRNIVYEEVEADYKSHGGTVVPALWDHQEAVLYSGFAQVMPVLEKLASTPAS